MPDNCSCILAPERVLSAPNSRTLLRPPPKPAAHPPPAQHAAHGVGESSSQLHAPRSWYPDTSHSAPSYPRYGELGAGGRVDTR
eukprot:6213317-Pleurochrysis_carterae.AAC.1